MSENKIKSGNLEDFKINIKIKLSAMWASVMFCYIYGDYFSLYVPNKVEEFIEGEAMLDTPFKLFAATLLMTVPALMIFLSVVLKPKINRGLNIVFGILYTAIMLLIAVTSIAPWWTFYVFLAVVESFITALIVWNAYKWPRINS
ncbi:DUF6326 family protein [Flavobacterium sp. Fl-318]|uniref:DUF6326 family protein n=1 Tax=Flavobacterium cupriresistens TaxID=2893885 RepID=A0ABU4RES9_9FLAO|nr:MULTISPECIES: DUF6326 family protein [unclassified Flavobacterium]MDX6191117.1 DUF6326 family protein [Flavobacterium sp. Fl-318]UFH42563.1 DUF6326 family protein [Flavobacterium sp. F-323]